MHYDVVIGDGWSALGVVGFLVQSGKEVCWVSGSGARMLSPTPSIEVGEAGGMGLSAWINLARAFDVNTGEPKTGCYLREFRNKSFRQPHWIKAPTPEARLEVKKENLWAPEVRLAPGFEARTDLTVAEIEEEVRTRLLSGNFKNLRRIDDLPVLSVGVENDRVCSITLGSGEVIECDHFYYADRWNSLRQIQGLPMALIKALASGRKREPVGVMQATFVHSVPMALGISEGFYALLNKEAGEENDRHVWGYFTSDGMKSVWTLCLSRDEVEDNHEIAKRFRRMKAALDKMFAGSAWLPQDKREFMATVESEHVRFEEAFLFSAGTLEQAADEIETHLQPVQNAEFLTDGFGATAAMHQVAGLFENARVLVEALSEASTQGESVELQGSGEV